MIREKFYCIIFTIGSMVAPTLASGALNVTDNETGGTALHAGTNGKNNAIGFFSDQ